MWTNVELRELRIFLALADELHFGRTAARLRVSQPGVSAAIRTLESRLGATLFERTSRRVRLTPVGEEFRRKISPIYAALEQTLADTSGLAGGVAGTLRVGFTTTTSGPALNHLVEMFQARYPGCEVRYSEVEMFDPYTALRHGEVDVLVNWLAVDEADLTVGPPIAYHDRVLAVASGHRLAGRESVSLEDLADEHVAQPPQPPFPAALCDAILPPRTPSGRIIRRTQVSRGALEILAHVARGRIVHPTMTGISLAARDDLALIPITDLPPMPLGLVWVSTQQNAKIRAFANLARSNGSPPVTQRD